MNFIDKISQSYTNLEQLLSQQTNCIFCNSDLFLKYYSKNTYLTKKEPLPLLLEEKYNFNFNQPLSKILEQKYIIHFEDKIPINHNFSYKDFPRFELQCHNCSYDFELRSSIISNNEFKYNTMNFKLNQFIIYYYFSNPFMEIVFRSKL